MLRDILAQLLDHDPRWRVVANLPSEAPLVGAVDRWQPDVLIADAPQTQEPLLVRLLYRQPHMLILAVRHDARDATLHRLVPRRHVVGELTLASLEAVLVAATDDPPIFDDPT